MTLSFIYLALGLILGNIGYLFTRDRESHATPVKFNLWFWITDNFIKVFHSVVIAVILNLICNVNVAHTSALLGFNWLPIFSVGLGLFPDAALSFMKDRFGWMQPKKAKDSEGKSYERKDP